MSMQFPSEASLGSASPLLMNAINKQQKENAAPILQSNPNVPQIRSQAEDVYVSSYKQARIKSQENLIKTIPALCFGALALVLLMPKKSNKVAGDAANELKQNGIKIWEDIKNSPTLKDLSLPDGLSKLVDKVKTAIDNPEAIKNKGGQSIGSILLYGPPGTGKTSFAKAIAKEYPNSRFANLDITGLNSKWVGEAEKNVQAAINEICDAAQKNPDTKFFVLIDEIDSIMLADKSDHNNKMLNEFKRCFTERLGKFDNIVTIGTTNISINSKLSKSVDGKELDKAMLDRFHEKILVGLPTDEQIKQAISSKYSKFSMICEELQKPDSPQLNKIAKFLADERRQTSFRTLDSLYKTAATVQDTSKKLTVQDFFDAIKMKQQELKITDMELQNFADSLGVEMGEKTSLVDYPNFGQTPVNIWEDLSSAKKLENLSLPDALSNLLAKIKKNIAGGSDVAKKGGKPVKTILLYGPPGTGKTSFAKAIAKEYPNSRFANLDITGLNSKYIGEGEKNMQAAVNEICDYAQKNPDTKFFVFIDEIDSIMMIDESINSDHNNKMLNEFKKCFTDKLGQHENIITVGATNLDIVDENPFSNKKLDKAMLDRFQEKILVDLPTSKQIKGAIMERYKNLPMVEDELKQDNERLGAICEFLANLKTVSFRHLDSFFDDAATYKDEAKVDIEAFFRAIQNKKTELKIPEDKLQKLAQEIKVEY